MFKKVPFHIFLLPVFFVLHVVNEYYLLIPLATILKFLCYYLLFSAILFLTGKLIYKSNVKAGIWVTALLTLFFFFGATHDFLKQLFHRSIVTSYTVLLPVLLIAGIAFSIYIKPIKKTFSRTPNFLLALFSLLTVFELVQLSIKKSRNEHEQIDLGYTSDNILEKIQFDKKYIKPDIFFIVLDEYASSHSLANNFSYNNNQLDSFFKSNHFYIADNSKSNYNCTPLSIASTFNLDYLNRPMPDTLTTKFWLKGWYTLKMSRLPNILAAQGYQIYNYGIWDFDHFPAHSTRYFTEFESKPLYEETLWGRIQRDVLWNIRKLHIPFIDRYFKNLSKKNIKTSIARNFSNLQSVTTQLKTQDNQPKFVFGHIMMPHPPYFFDRHGKFSPDSTHLHLDRHNKKLYLEQLIYTNKLITPMICAANTSFARPRVIIIEGDHGFREKNGSSSSKNDFMNLSTYYFSNKEYLSLYDSISPVNTFRIVFNKYFNTQLPLLKDSTIFIRL